MLTDDGDPGCNCIRSGMHAYATTVKNKNQIQEWDDIKRTILIIMIDYHKTGPIKMELISLTTFLEM